MGRAGSEIDLSHLYGSNSGTVVSHEPTNDMNSEHLGQGYRPGWSRLRAWPMAGMKSFFRDMTRVTVHVSFSTFTLNAFSTIQVSPFSSIRSCPLPRGFVTRRAARS